MQGLHPAQLFALMGHAFPGGNAGTYPLHIIHPNTCAPARRLRGVCAHARALPSRPSPAFTLPPRTLPTHTKTRSRTRSPAPHRPLLSAPSPHVRPQDTIILQPLYYCSPKITGMRTSTLAAVLAAAGVCRLACGGVGEANSDGCRRPRVACQRLCALEMSARETKWEKRPTITHNPGVIMRPRLCVDAGAAGAGSSSRGLRASATRSR